MRSLRKCVNLNSTVIVIIFLIYPLCKAVFSEEQAVLKLILNEQDKGEFFFVIAPEGDIWITRSDFDQLGLKKGLGKEIQYNGVTYISLKSVPELAFSINEENVSLDIHASPSLFGEHDVDSAYTKPYKVIYTRDSSAFLNYAVNYDRREQETTLNISGELGLSAGSYLGMTTFIYNKFEDTDRAVRLMTSLEYNDRDKLQKVILGDFSASSGALGSVILLGGASYSKNFSMDPFFFKMPPLNLSGTIETPSDVEVYLDGTLVRREQMSPGEITFQDIPATVGFGNANMIIKDVYGRERTVTTPYYYSERLLKKGLHEYSYNAGFIREDFGAKSFSYGKPAALVFHNYGLSNNLKIGYAAEASSDLINIGPAVSFLVANKGVVDAAFALSSDSGESGHSGMLGYTYQSRNINVRLFVRSDSREYSNLVVEPSDDKAEFQFAGSIGFGGKDTGFLGVEYVHADMYEMNQSSRVTVSYNRLLTERASLFINASETRDTETEDEIFFGIHVYFGKDMSGSVNYTKGDDLDIQRIGIQKNQPPGDGYGFRADMVNSNDTDYVSGAASYQNRYGSYNVDVTGSSEDTEYRLSASGGIGYIDQSVFFSRPITDSFAKVKVDKLENVRVYYYGNEMGRTNKNGEFIIPDIRSYQDNKIDIEVQDIPIDYSITSLSQYISPSFRNGAVVVFGISRIQVIVGNIHIIREGARIPAEFARLFVQEKDSISEWLVGRSGEFYMENIPPGRYPAKIVHKGEECVFDIIIPEIDEMFLNVGDITCEMQN